MMIAELLGAGSTWLHVIGVILLLGRLVHVFGIRYDKGDALPRIIGGGATTLATLIAAGTVFAKVIAG